MDILEIPHVTYRLIHALVVIDGKEQETWLSVSEDFRAETEEKMAYDLFYDLEKEKNESPLDFALRNGWELSIYQIFLIDYLTANKDRHGSNIEVLRNIEDETLCIAPLFDQGVSLLFSTYGDEKLLENADVMRDFPVNNYIGTRSLNRYAIKRKNENKIVGILNYNEQTKTYTIEIPENVSWNETPFMLSLFLKKGIRKIDSD